MFYGLIYSIMSLLLSASVYVIYVYICTYIYVHVRLMKICVLFGCAAAAVTTLIDDDVCAVENGVCGCGWREVFTCRFRFIFFLFLYFASLVRLALSRLTWSANTLLAFFPSLFSQCCGRCDNGDGKAAQIFLMWWNDQDLVSVLMRWLWARLCKNDYRTLICLACGPTLNLACFGWFGCDRWWFNAALPLVNLFYVQLFYDSYPLQSEQELRIFSCWKSYTCW